MKLYQPMEQLNQNSVTWSQYYNPDINQILNFKYSKSSKTQGRRDH